MHVTYDIDYDAIRRHIRERFAQAVVKDTPFPHVQVEQMLPEAYYDMLLDALPMPQDVGSDNSKPLNFGAHKDSKHFTQMTAQRQELWTSFEEKVNQPVIRQEMIALFARYLPLKLDMMLGDPWLQRAENLWGKDWKRVLADSDAMFAPLAPPFANSGMRFLLVTNDFTLPRHVDDAGSLLTYLLYLPRDNTHESLGTRMHLAANPEKLCKKYQASKDMNVWHPRRWDVKRETLSFPFRRNMAVAFLCVPTAIHSIDFHEINYCRYALQTQVFLPDNVCDALFTGWSKKRTGY